MRGTRERSARTGFHYLLLARAESKVDWALAFVLFVAAMVLYIRTMAPGLLDGDEGEFQINIFRLGVSHTGYPTFFLLGKLWTLLVPIGTIAARANLFSAFWGALTIAALYTSVIFLTHSRWAGLVSALLLLGSRVEWSQAVIPRPYTLNSLFVILVPLTLFLWRAGKVDLTVPIFVFSASLTNHRTIMWFAPAIALFVLAHEGKALLKPRRLITVATAFILPLLLYGYVWWRGESDVGVEFHWKDFNDEIMGGYVRASWRFGPLDWLISRVTELYIPMLIEQFTAIGFIAGLLGMMALALKRVPRRWPSQLPPRQVLVFLVLANLANTAFCVIFWVIDIDKFFLPSFITFLFFTGIGVAVILDGLAQRRRPVDGRILAAACTLALLIPFGFLVDKNLPLNDWSQRTDVALGWEENLAQPLEPNAIIAGPWESITPLEYAMYVDGRRSDLERWKLLTKTYQLGQVPYGSRQEDIEKAAREGRAVYLTVHPGETETLGALLDEFRLIRVGELWRVLNAPPRDNARFESISRSKARAAFGDRESQSLELVDYDLLSSPSLRSGDFSYVTLFWRMPQTTRDRFVVSLRLTDMQNHLVYQRDSEPAGGLRPTKGWSAGEVVQDDVGFFVPPDAPPGEYRLAVLVYNAETGENLKNGQGNSLVLHSLNVSVPVAARPAELLPIPHRLDISIPPFRLMGYGLDTQNPTGGDEPELSLWWQVEDASAQHNRTVISFHAPDGRTLSVFEGAPVANLTPSTWAVGAILRGRYTLPIPLDWSGSVRLAIQSDDRTVEFASLNIQPSGRTLLVPSIPHPQVAQLGDSIKLLGYDLDKSQARPGESIRLTLYWQSIKSPATSYTVFAHALDPNGILRGQRDSLPRNGDLPTDHWVAGEVIADVFEIPIALDAPAGSYQFEIGMYLGETGERLPVFDANGSPLADNRVLTVPWVVAR